MLVARCIALESMGVDAMCADGVVMESIWVVLFLGAGVVFASYRIGSWGVGGREIGGYRVVSLCI